MPGQSSESLSLHQIVEERLGVSTSRILDFCHKWQIAELSLFGSVLRDDFSAQSDVDVLVSFAESSRWTLWDYMEMKEELEKVFGRSVDLVSQRALKNPYRRQTILASKRTLYAA